MSYRSPVDGVVKGFKTAFEDGVFKGVLEVGISIDKDELIRCLDYDRGQYEIGYTDGYFAGKNSVVRCKDCKYWRGENTADPITNLHYGDCTNVEWRDAEGWDKTTCGHEFCSRGERNRDENS